MTKQKEKDELINLIDERIRLMFQMHEEALRRQFLEHEARVIEQLAMRRRAPRTLETKGTGEEHNGR